MLTLAPRPGPRPPCCGSCACISACSCTATRGGFRTSRRRRCRGSTRSRRATRRSAGWRWSRPRSRSRPVTSLSRTSGRASVHVMRMGLRSRQGGRRVVLVLGLLLLSGVITGILANTVGVTWPLDLIQVHAAGALAILLLAPWKYVVIRRGLRRTRRPRPVKALSLTLLGFVLVTVASGLIHSAGHLEFVGPLTLMQIHVGAAVGALAAVLGHFVLHAVRPRAADADRRAPRRPAGRRGGAPAAALARGP